MEAYLLSILKYKKGLDKMIFVKIKYVYIYFFLAVILIGAGLFFTPENMSENTVDVLGIEDVLFIFAANFLQFCIWIALSPIGISLPFIMKFLYSMGEGPRLAGESPVLYYFSSFTHGIGELAAGLLLFCFTLEQFKLFYFLLVGQTVHVKKFYMNAVKKILVPVFLILLISAFLEVYVSNKIYLVLQGVL